MRIRTQLFLGTAALILSLVGIQWWLQLRQLKAIEREVNEVAKSVGERVILSNAFFSRFDTNGPLPLPPGIDPKKVPQMGNFTPGTAVFISEGAEKTAPPAGGNESPKPGEPKGTIRFESNVNHKIVIRRSGTPGEIETTQFPTENLKPGETTVQKNFVVKIEPVADNAERMLVISGLPDGPKKIPIPTSKSTQIVQSTIQQQLIAACLLLVVGSGLAAMFAHRMTSPLRTLAEGTEAIGRGELGVQVPVSGRGEIGELQKAFNRMSSRLAQLETERKAWKAREHLAELGDLARGLGHTLRNPLNTLGLVVEELAGRGTGDGSELVTTARGQIKRIDWWLRSFLTLGAGQAATPEIADLRDVLNDVVFETSQSGHPVTFDSPDEPMHALVVAPAIRAALSNLVNNAVEASPAETPVSVTMTAENDCAMIAIRDHGPGLPEEVRSRLFTPHVTTKTGGSGMGLFLARQLVEGTGAGTLLIGDAEGGGTLVTVCLPLYR